MVHFHFPAMDTKTMLYLLTGGALHTLMTFVFIDYSCSLHGTWMIINLGNAAEILGDRPVRYQSCNFWKLKLFTTPEAIGHRLGN